MTQEKILRVALQCFTENGYDGTSMEDIAVAAGMPVSGIYRHFAGKAELLAASAASQQYAFRILHAGRVLASGRAAAMLGA